jgi:hypothetical protein
MFEDDDDGMFGGAGKKSTPSMLRSKAMSKGRVVKTLLDSDDDEDDDEGLFGE